MSSPSYNPQETAAVFAQERDAAGGADAPVAIGNVLNAAVKFTQVDIYTTFLAEYAFIDGDIVIHYFPPREQYVQVPGTDTHRLNADFNKRWRQVFPVVLSPVAEAYFRATKPTLVAQYVPEMTSWWMRCQGFAERLDPDGYVRSFFEVLDRALDAV